MLQRWMSFVDGENLTIRAQGLAGKLSIKLREGGYYRKDCFVWVPDEHAHALGLIEGTKISDMRRYATRAYYYTSLTGTTETITDVRTKLRKLGFEPVVFKKTKPNQKAKGVDIALTKDMLSHAFLSNYDTVRLVAGDGDYVPLVEEVKRLGKCVQVAFFKGEGLSEELKLAADHFLDLTQFFTHTWNNWLKAHPDG